MSQLPEVDGGYEYPDYDVHPAAAIFPMLGEAELRELADDIREHGLAEPIVVWGSVLLDGRNRLAACELACVEPTFREWEGEEHEIIPWVLSKNLHRRHLTTSQRAAVAASLATLGDGQRQVGKFADVPTQAQAAKLLGVSDRSVRHARTVLESGNEELIEAVKSGEVSVSAAVAQLRPAEQRPLDMSAALSALGDYLTRHNALALRPQQISLALAGVQTALGRSLSEAERRELLEEGRKAGRWQTSSSISDAGHVVGSIWLPARERSERGADGGGADAPVGSATPASLSLASMPPLWAARARKLLAKLDQGHGGSARLVELRHSARESLGQLGEDGWATLLREGTRAGLWTIEGERIRLVRATAPSSDTDTDGDGSKYSEPDPPGDETSADEDIEDDEQDPDEGPVLPEDPDDPAVQGHRAALEEGVYVDCDACSGVGQIGDSECEECGGTGGVVDTDIDSDTDTNDEGADATPVTAAEAPYPKGTIGYAQDGIAKWLGLLGARSYAKRIEIDTIRRSYEREEGKLSDRAFAQAVRMGEGERWEASGAYIWLVDSSSDEGAQAAMKAASVPPSKPPKPRPSAMPPDELPVPPPAPRDLPDDQRAELDAYYTPDLHARALVRWLAANVYAGQDPQRILEPSVGGGAWLRACRDEWPEAHLRALDIDPAAPGLKLADRPEVGDFLTADLISADLIVGNPPYGGDLVAWIDRSRELAPVVGYLLRSTFLGAAERLEWWQRRPPSDVIVVLPRPAWEGPGKRATTDRVDSLFVVWRGAVAGSTRLHWLDAREGA